MKDPIERRAAIDAICKACSIVGDYHKCDGYPETSTWCDELVALRALPSAEPDRYTIDCILYNLYNQLSHRVGTEAMVERKDWIEQLYEEIFGKGTRPVWMT